MNWSSARSGVRVFIFTVVFFRLSPALSESIVLDASAGGEAKASTETEAKAGAEAKADAGPEGPGWIDQRIAEAFDVTSRTVENVRRQLVEEGLQPTITRKPQCRPSRQRLLDGEKEARLVALCCGKVPAGRGRWTLRMLADELVELKIVDQTKNYQPEFDVKEW